MVSLQAAGVPAGVCQRTDEALIDPHLTARDWFWPLDHPMSVRTSTTAIRGPSPGRRCRRPASAHRGSANTVPRSCGVSWDCRMRRSARSSRRRSREASSTGRTYRDALLLEERLERLDAPRPTMRGPGRLPAARSRANRSSATSLKGIQRSSTASVRRSSPARRQAAGRANQGRRQARKWRERPAAQSWRGALPSKTTTGSPVQRTA
jgi:hypothetical protein